MLIQRKKRPQRDVALQKQPQREMWQQRNSHNAKFCIVEVTVKKVRVLDWKSLTTSEPEGDLT